jgi:hypothetical protein
MTIPTHTTLTPAPPTNPRLRCGERPTEPKSALFVGALGFAQFGLFVALLGPVIVSMALKVNTLIASPTERTSALGVILGVGGGASGTSTPNYTLMLWAAAIAALVGALVVLPIKKVK